MRRLRSLVKLIEKKQRKPIYTGLQKTNRQSKQIHLAWLPDPRVISNSCRAEARPFLQSQ